MALLGINHDKDHIHMFLFILPKMRIGGVVCRIKSTTGLLLKGNVNICVKPFEVLLE
ncbi:MAG: transposase [Rickettsiaceae bacterium]